VNAVVLIARLGLAAIFTLAGLTKLSDLRSSVDTVEAFGLPRRLARPAGVVLPFAELVVAIALLPSPSARWGAVAAVILLSTFSAGVAYALHEGRTPDCNCFGQVSSEQISWRTLVRNGLFAAVAVFTVFEAPGSALTSWTSDHSAANLVAGLVTLAAAILAAAAYGLSRRPFPDHPGSPAMSNRPALPPGASAPDFELLSLDGALVSLPQLLARERPVVIVFASPTCGHCLQLLPRLSRWNGAIGDDLTLVVVESGVGDDGLPDDQRHAVKGLITLTAPDRELEKKYYVHGTPSGISISADGLISSSPMPGTARIEQLIRRVLETGGTVPGEDELTEVAVRG
jgi:thiol-disulfide isomerase/thioredoxin